MIHTGVANDGRMVYCFAGNQYAVLAFAKRGEPISELQVGPHPEGFGPHNLRPLPYKVDIPISAPMTAAIRVYMLVCNIICSDTMALGTQVPTLDVRTIMYTQIPGNAPRAMELLERLSKKIAALGGYVIPWDTSPALPRGVVNISHVHKLAIRQTSKWWLKDANNGAAPKAILH